MCPKSPSRGKETFPQLASEEGASQGVGNQEGFISIRDHLKAKRGPIVSPAPG